MRFMVIRRADKSTEAGGRPSKALLDAMTKYHEDGAKAGIVLDGTGLQPSSKGARVKIAGGKATVIDGPFTETKELIAGSPLHHPASVRCADVSSRRDSSPSEVRRWPGAGRRRREARCV